MKRVGLLVLLMVTVGCHVTHHHRHRRYGDVGRSIGKAAVTIFAATLIIEGAVVLVKEVLRDDSDSKSGDDAELNRRWREVRDRRMGR